MAATSIKLHTFAYGRTTSPISLVDRQ